MILACEETVTVDTVAASLMMWNACAAVQCSGASKAFCEAARAPGPARASGFAAL